MNKLFDYLIVRPVQAILAVLAVLFGGLYIDARLALATMETRAITAEAKVSRQSDAALAVAAQAAIRADAAAKAQAAAFEYGRADRAAAAVYLTLPTPPTELQCAAASALVDAAVAENAR
jgi:hypothetical protein